MGAWGAGPFDNDDASDWVEELSDRGLAAMSSVFQTIPTDIAQYVEAPEASAAVAAAEVLAIMRGNESGEVPVEIEDWLEDQDDPPHELIKEARRAVARVYESSELRDLWDEADGRDWHQYMQGLLKRL